MSHHHHHQHIPHIDVTYHHGHVDIRPDYGGHRYEHHYEHHHEHHGYPYPMYGPGPSYAYHPQPYTPYTYPVQYAHGGFGPPMQVYGPGMPGYRPY